MVRHLNRDQKTAKCPLEKTCWIAAEDSITQHCISSRGRMLHVVATQKSEITITVDQVIHIPVTIKRVSEMEIPIISNAGRN